MKLNGVVIKDKKFIVEIPDELVKISDVIDGSFCHILEFKNNESIVVLDFINLNLNNSITALNIDYKRFRTLCEKENINSELENLHIKKNRRFGFFKPTNKSYYIMYLNVKGSDVLTFNYSIDNFKLLNN